MNNKIIAICFLSQCLIGCVTPGSGRVLDSKTSEPIKDALVTMDCRRAQFHGSRSIKEESDITSDNGVYDFGLFDVIRCDYAYVHAEKDGYVELHHPFPVPYVGFDPHAIPKTIFLTPIPEAEKLYLEYLCGHSRIHSLNDEFLNNKFSYYSRYINFLTARGYARSIDDTKFIVECFCSDLIDSYNVINDDDKIWLKNQSINPLVNYHHMPQKIDHEKEVVPYCNENTVISK